MTCTAMLEQGFHKSFEELFSLVEGQRREHERAGPAAVLLEPLVEHDLAKLELLSSQVLLAERGLCIDCSCAHTHVLL